MEKLNNYGQNGLNRKILGSDVQRLITGYSGLTELMPATDGDAILEPLGAHRNPLSHKKFKEFIENEFDLEPLGIKPGSRVGVLLPNGPEMAVTLFAVMSKWTAAPINLTNTWEEMKAELQSTKAVAIIILTGAVGNEEAVKAAESLSLGIITITPSGTFSGIFHAKLLQPVSSETTSAGYNAVANIATSGRMRTVLLLHTSGTSGNKKCVPYTLETLIVGVGVIVSSWDLRPSDICLNMMPLFHIGRQSPLCSPFQISLTLTSPFSLLLLLLFALCILQVV